MNNVMKKMRNQKGFTLIELLIVIGLLGALTALVLPSMMADREEALLSICDYNQAGTIRTLHQFNNLMGGLPDAFHTGLDTAGAAMSGIPAHTATQMGLSGSITDFATIGASGDSLIAAGMTNLAADEGYNLTAIAAASNIVRVLPESTPGTNDGWQDDGLAAFAFDGRTIAQWEDEDTSTTNDDGDVIVLFVTPTIEWETANPNNDWTGGSVELEIELEGKCPIPADSDFAYYMAYVKVYDDGSLPAQLIGSSCPECGVMNP